MAVSKRLRYEILRRDSNTCRYCGAKAPDVPLRVDHVTPVALGGTDEPSNLVTSCEPCNSGKTSSTPDAALVAGVADDALRWAAAMKQAAENLLAKEGPKSDYRQAFLDQWNRWGYGEGDNRKHLSLPGDWKASIERFRLAGLPPFVWAEITGAAMANPKVKTENTFRYCCGIAWRMVAELQEDARSIASPKIAGPGRDELRHLVSMHLYATWAWAWARISGDTPRDSDARDFVEEMAELLDRGLSAQLDLTEIAFEAGSDRATDPSSYLPDEYLTDEDRAARLPPSDEEMERLGGAYGAWWSGWSERDSAGPTAKQDRTFARQIRQAAAAGYEGEEISHAAYAAGLDTSPEIVAYLPERRTEGGEV
jgi:hypothetical protein